ncbi:Agamous-like MADS-box protein AGL61 [Linum grandiflorum]
MKKIERDTNLMVTFSKRKLGIYKMANELVTLVGCEMGFLVFSPTGKPFSYAHPSFDHIARRYLGQYHHQHQDPFISYAMEASKQAKIEQLTKRYNDVLEQYENELRKEIALLVKFDGEAPNNWWNRSIDNVQGYEIEWLENAYMEMLNMVERKKMEIMMGINCFIPADLINSNNYNTNTMNGNDVVVGPFSSGFSSFDHMQSLLQPPMDMVSQTEPIMNMERPNLVEPLPIIGRPNLVRPPPNFSMVGLPSDSSEVTGSIFTAGLSDGRAEAFDSFSMVGPASGGNGGVGSSSMFTFSHMQ